MKLVVVSIYDRAASAYSRPVYTASTGLAIRSFQDECNRDAQDNEVFKHPEDFDLFYLGDFNDEDGFLDQLERPQLLMTASQAKK